MPAPGHTLLMMTPKTVSAHAPGKLFIAGEYAVVQPAHPAIVVAINRGITVTIHPAPLACGVVITSAAYSHPLTWQVDTPVQDYLTAAIQVVEDIARARGVAHSPYRVEVISELVDESGRKYGLGSSGAVTVATVEALGEFYQLGLNRVEIYRLAMLATILISPRASGGDVAASTFGGWVHYTAPDQIRLRQAHRDHGSQPTVADDALWKETTLMHLPPPPLPLLVGWSGEPAHTPTQVAQASTTKVEEFYEASNAAVAHLHKACHQHDEHVLLEAISRARL